MSADLEALRVAVAHQHERLDAWLSALEGCLAEAEVPTAVEADPRFDAAVENLAEADVQRQLLALEVLGIDLDTEDAQDDADAASQQMASDVFGVSLVVAVPETADPGQLDDVLDVLDAAADGLVSQLEAAGFLVPELALSRGLDDDELDELDELDDDGAGEAAQPDVILGDELDRQIEAALNEDEDGSR